MRATALRAAYGSARQRAQAALKAFIFEETSVKLVNN